VLFRKKLLFLFSLILLIGFVFGSLSKVYAATFEEQVVSLINTERQNQNLAQLNFSDKLFQAASKHNSNMSDCSLTHDFNSCFSHQISIIGEPILMDRVKATGYNPSSVAENIAWGQLTPAAVVASWMGSSGHRENILGGYNDIGCDYLDSMDGSYKGIYWTCVFGKSFTASTSVPTVKPTPTLIKLAPTSTPRPTPTKIPTPTPSKSPTPTLTPTNIPTPTSIPVAITTASKSWWCIFIPSFIQCQ